MSLPHQSQATNEVLRLGFLLIFYFKKFPILIEPRKGYIWPFGCPLPYLSYGHTQERVLNLVLYLSKKKKKIGSVQEPVQVSQNGLEFTERKRSSYRSGFWSRPTVSNCKL